MEFLKPRSKANKKLFDLITKICIELNIDESVAIHFISRDLERIYNNVHIDDIKLNQLENEIKKQLQEETDLKQEIEKKEALIKNLAIKITVLSASCDEKAELLENRRQELFNLTKKVNELNSSLNEIEKQKKKSAYELIIKNHAIKTKSNSSFKKINIILSFFTVIAIIIAIFLILHKRK